MLDELQDPFDVQHLTESLRVKPKDNQSNHEMAMGCSTDRVLMVIQVKCIVQYSNMIGVVNVI